MAVRIRFYLDENVPIAVAEQLLRRGIDAVTVRDMGLLGQSDVDHLAVANRIGRVLCTHDSNYLDMARAGVPHGGIVFGQQHKHGVGSWVGFLELIFSIYDAEEMSGRVEYL